MFPARQYSPASAHEQLRRVPPAPRKPSRRARKLIFAYAGAQFGMLLGGIIFAVVGTGLSIPFLWGLPVDLALEAQGRAVQGEVLGSELNTHVSINDRHPTTVRFSYELDGRRAEAETDTLDSALATLSPGAQVEVEALPGRPGWARLKGETYSSFGYAVAFVAVFPLIGFALMFFAMRSNRREISAFVNGRPVVARVVFAGPDLTTRVNGRHPFKVEWEFRTPDGDVHSGSITSMKLLELEEYANSGEVVVLHDPERPHINTLWVE